MPRNPSRSQLRAQKQFMEEVEMAIRAANREILGKQLPGLDRESFFRLAVAVAKLRASYLDAVLHMDWENASSGLGEIKAKRQLFEEAVAAFEALERTIERGYIDISQKPGK